MQLEYKAEIKDGKLLVVDQKNMIRDIAVHQDCEVTLIIKRRYKNRSKEHNAYYWAVVIPRIQQGLRDMHGEYYDSEEVHDFLKQRFNSKIIINRDTSEAIEFATSTSKLDVIEFTDFVNNAKRFALEFLNIDIDADVLPFPDEKKSEFKTRTAGSAPQL